MVSAASRRRRSSPSLVRLATSRLSRLRRARHRAEQATRCRPTSGPPHPLQSARADSTGTWGAGTGGGPWPRGSAPQGEDLSVCSLTVMAAFIWLLANPHGTLTPTGVRTSASGSASHVPAGSSNSLEGIALLTQTGAPAREGRLDRQRRDRETSPGSHRGRRRPSRTADGPGSADAAEGARRQDRVGAGRLGETARLQVPRLAHPRQTGRRDGDDALPHEHVCRWWPQRGSNPCFSLERAVS
jgi:hypothetical protein